MDHPLLFKWVLWMLEPIHVAIGTRDGSQRPFDGDDVRLAVAGEVRSVHPHRHGMFSGNDGPDPVVVIPVVPDQIMSLSGQV